MKLNTIVSVLALTSVLMGASAFATDVFQSKGLSADCETKIIATVTRRCNSDSLKAEGKDRMNPCIQPETDVATSGKFNGQLEVGESAGDADTYWYAIQIKDAARCSVSISAEQ